MGFLRKAMIAPSPLAYTSCLHLSSNFFCREWRHSRDIGAPRRRHSREGGNPLRNSSGMSHSTGGIPAFAGMTGDS